MPIERAACLEADRRELGIGINKVISKDLGGKWSVCVHLHYYSHATVSVWFNGIDKDSAEFKITENGCTIKKVGAHGDKIDKIKAALENALGVN